MKRHKHPEHINHERWLVSYADFITLLFAFFVVMFAVSRVDTKQLGRFSESFQQAVGLFDGHSNGLLPDAGNGIVDAGQGMNAGEGNKEVNEVQEALARQQQENPGEALARAKVMRRRNELVLRLDDNIVFDSGDDRVREQAAKALRAVANLVKNRKVELRVEGHTDNIPVRNGRFRSNWELSTARATAVITELAQAGLAPERLSAAGYGEFHPVGPNDSPEARSKNRRVDLVISGLSTPAPEQPATLASAQPAASAGRPAGSHSAAPGQHDAPAGQHDAAAGQHEAPIEKPELTPAQLGFSKEKADSSHGQPAASGQATSAHGQTESQAGHHADPAGHAQPAAHDAGKAPPAHDAHDAGKAPPAHDAHDAGKAPAAHDAGKAEHAPAAAH